VFDGHMESISNQEIFMISLACLEHKMIIVSG
jgi:hypothetical protein